MMDGFQHEVGEWGKVKFPQASELTIAIHLTREAAELRRVAETFAACEGVPPEIFEEECADCLLLLLHIAHRAGFSLLEAARQKFSVVKTREWGEADDEGVREHIRHVEGGR